MIFRLKPLNSVPDCIESNNFQKLSKQRNYLDFGFIKKTRFGLYNIDIAEYTAFNNNYHKRNGTINLHFGPNYFRYSIYKNLKVLIHAKTLILKF